MLALLLSTSLALAGARGSSELTDSDGKHPSLLAFDGLLKSGWGEGAPGNGEGSWLELDLGRATEVSSLSLWPGNLKEGAKSFREYSRPRAVQIYVDDAPVGGVVNLEDKPRRYDIPLAAKGQKVKAKKIKVEVKEVYEGIVFSDLFVAEIAVDFPNGASVDKLEAWRKGKDGTAQQTAFETKVEEAYAAQKASEFGDDAAFALLTDAVADGAPYLRDRVKALVPDGYRASAITSDPKAQEALRKLKDPNAIPSFQLAMLRATGDEAKALQDVVEIFEAYQELIGGGNRNVPYWGASGWEPGALRGFDEPLAMALDREGNVYVADTGNNRVQQYAENGRPVRQWGPKADITDAWFEDGRKWYVSGAKPGTGPGEFITPLDVEILPRKEGDAFAVLDARGRVQVFNPDGSPASSWSVSAANPPEPGLGGTAYLVYVPQKERLYAIIQDEAIGFDATGAEVARWEIKDGTPKAAGLGPGGKMLMAFGEGIVAFDPDGFRYGAWSEAGALGQGFEDLDLAMDAQERVWAITDLGQVFLFKKNGKVEFSVSATTRQVRHPRMVVRDGIVHFTNDDRVEVIDALQARMDQEADAAEEGGKKGKKGKKGGEESP